MLKMMTIADDKHFSYQNENDLVDFIASEMHKDVRTRIDKTLIVQVFTNGS